MRSCWFVLTTLCAVSAAYADVLETKTLPALPEPVSNNAVAVLTDADGTTLFSFLGLGAGKTWRDPSSKAFVLAPGAEQWRELPDVPGDKGRLAATAVEVGGSVYVFGGYTVAEDGSEESVETVHRFDPGTETYSLMNPMPVPVDDAVSLVYLDRYVYLVSGWHAWGNVNLVQLFDTQTNTWRQATPYPGVPVFGHAGGNVGEALVVCDGVKIVHTVDEDRSFEASDECWLGRIHADDPSRIDWWPLQKHPGKPLYRMAATGTTHSGGLILFAGGSDNPYNYNGIGYDEIPSSGSDRVFGISIQDMEWIELGQLPSPTMDHRGLLPVGDGFVIVGGMSNEQQVTDGVIKFSIP
ncbi:MAG: galactose oxidase [Gammaproteobacteria bacterium]